MMVAANLISLRKSLNPRLLPLFIYCLTYLPEPGKLATVILLVSACAEILVRVVAELLEFHQG